MKNPFYRIFLQPNFREGHVITWELDPTFSDTGPWKFTLQAAEVPTFSEVFYSDTQVGVAWLIDKSHRKQNWDYAWYYRVILETKDGKYTSSSIMLGGNKVRKMQYMTAAEVVRKELLLMQQKTGLVAYLLKRKIYSEVAEALVDPVSGVALADTTKDMGTGLVDGYHDPIRILVQSMDNKNTKKLNPDGNGVDEYQYKQFRMVGFPLVSPRDVIAIPQSDTRYMVHGEPEYTLFPGTEVVIVQQHLSSLLPNTDTVYSIPVPTS